MKHPLTKLLVGLGVVTLLVHWGAVGNEFTYWDDWGYVELANQHRLTWAGIKWAFTSTYIYYQPLTWLSHGLDCVLWGVMPAGHHAQSVVWHALNAVLVAGLAWQLSKWAAPWSETERLYFAGWVGIVFAVHPLQVEAVAWIAGRKTVLAAFFTLLAAMAYVRWANAEHERRWWWAMLGAYGLALLSKPMAVSLPVALVALDIFPLRRVEVRGWFGIIREKWLLLLLAGIVGVATIIGQAEVGALTAVPLGPVERGLVAARSLYFYLWKMLFPVWLSPFYPLGEWNNYRQAEFVLPVVICFLIGGVAIALWRRAPQVAATGVGYLAFVLPVSGLFQAGGQAVADRFAYLPIVPVLLLCGGGLVVLRRQLAEKYRGVLGIVLGAHLLWLVARTQQQIPVWHDSARMWQEVCDQISASTTEYGYAAAALTREKRYDEALIYAEQAYQLLPATAADSREQVGKIFRDLAATFVEVRRFPECVLAGFRATELLPGDAVGHAALGLGLLKVGKPREAVAPLERAVELRGNLPAARYNLACAYAGTGRLEDAARVLAEAVALEPGLAGLAERDPALARLREGK
ncbi:MAG: hypothetical protein PCFJNLEI_02529 [Verrucomicrobiae bacterium]|nr:hypothetical protein [Verrucomicrobiae bacterium]